MINKRGAIHFCCTVGIISNMMMVAVNLFMIDNPTMVFVNVISGLLCWVGYYNTKE